jgi:hypothetical protein
VLALAQAAERLAGRDPAAAHEPIHAHGGQGEGLGESAMAISRRSGVPRPESAPGDSRRQRL